MNTVIIIVEGGVVQSIASTGDMRAIVIDNDNPSVDEYLVGNDVDNVEEYIKEYADCLASEEEEEEEN